MNQCEGTSKEFRKSISISSTFSSNACILCMLLPITRPIYSCVTFGTFRAPSFPHSLVTCDSSCSALLLPIRSVIYTILFVQETTSSLTVKKGKLYEERRDFSVFHHALRWLFHTHDREGKPGSQSHYKIHLWNELSNPFEISMTTILSISLFLIRTTSNSNYPYRLSLL